MNLYHGTTETIAKEVLEEGLLPRGMDRAGNWGHTVDSRTDAIYLSDIYSVYFAQHSLSIKKLDAVRGAILEVPIGGLDLDLLMPDEDFLEQASRESDIPGVPNADESTMLKRTEFFRSVAHTDDWRMYWPKSIEALGTVSHLGSIPKEAISRVAFIDFKVRVDILTTAMDPSISLMNHLICKEKYEALTRFIFGEKISPHELAQVRCTKEEFNEWPPELRKSSIAWAKQILSNREGIELLTLNWED